MTVDNLVWSHLCESLLSKDSLDNISLKFKEELASRLQNSNISMLPTKTLEKGVRTSLNSSTVTLGDDNTILAIDFGGTSLKIALVTMPTCIIQYRDEFQVTNKVVDLKFFAEIIEWICSRLDVFYASKKVSDWNLKPLFVAITFSFPLNAEKEIAAMGKGFIMTDSIKNVGLDEIIKNSFIQSGVENVTVCDIINDSVAVYLTSEFICDTKESCSVSLIVGTGTNTCFELPFDALPKFKRDPFQVEKTSSKLNVVINGEMGFLGSKVIELAPFDVQNDSPCTMPLEYITSGKWLPIILKNIICYYNIIPELNGKMDDLEIDGQLLCQLVESENLENIKVKGVPQIQLPLVRDIAKLLLNRGAFYLVAALKAIFELKSELNDENENENDSTANVMEIGYVGSFLQNCSYYHEQIDFFSENKITLKFMEDSNLIGAAIAAFVKD